MAVKQSISIVYDRLMNKPTLLVVLSMFFAGSNVVFGKAVAGSGSVFAIGATSMLFALIAILPLQLTRLPELRRLRREDMGYMAVQAGFGIVLFRAFVLLGLRMTSAIDAGIILSTTPAVMTLGAFLALRERPSRRQLAAVMLAVLAVATITTIDQIIGTGNRGNAGTVEVGGRLAGNGLVLIAVVGESLMTISRRKAGPRVSAITNTGVLVVMSLCGFLLFGLFSPGPIIVTEGSAMVGVAWLGVMGTVVGYLLWGYGAARVPAATTGVAMVVLPITTAGLAFLILGEEVGPAQLVGIACGLYGIWLGTRRDPSSVAQQQIPNRTQKALN